MLGPVQFQKTDPHHLLIYTSFSNLRVARGNSNSIFHGKLLGKQFGNLTWWCQILLKFSYQTQMFHVWIIHLHKVEKWPHPRGNVGFHIPWPWSMWEVSITTCPQVRFPRIFQPPRHLSPHHKLNILRAA